VIHISVQLDKVMPLKGHLPCACIAFLAEGLEHVRDGGAAQGEHDQLGDSLASAYLKEWLLALGPITGHMPILSNIASSR
jgi:hypothetical protein